jgi:predicted small secreted protein
VTIPSPLENPMRVLALILFSCVFLASCQTIKGAGDDIRDAGEAIDDAISDE